HSVDLFHDLSFHPRMLSRVAMALMHRIGRLPRRDCTQAQQSRYDLATRSFADRTTASFREGNLKPGMPLFSHLKIYFSLLLAITAGGALSAAEQPTPESADKALAESVQE